MKNVKEETMNDYLFNLGQLGVVKISAPNKLVACEMFAEMGYDPSCIISIDVDLGGVL